MLLHPANSLIQIGKHFESTELRYRTRPNCEDGISLAAQDLECLSTSMVANLGSVGMPGAADHVYDSQAVLVSFRSKNIHQQADTMNFSKDDILLLRVGRVLRRRR